ncbi:MAG: hypothetical protein ABJH04_07980 [Cyclobacteriaceae bacterium]
MKLYSFTEIKTALTNAAVSDKLPLDMTLLNEEELFATSEGVLKEVESLGQYISEDSDRYETTEEAYNLLVKQSEIDGSVIADDIVMMWEPLESRYTVDQLLELL